MTYPLRVLGLLYSDPKGKQLWEIKLGFHPLEPNFQVLRNTLQSLKRRGLIEQDRKLGTRHFVYKITPKGKEFFERNYLPLRLIEETKIKPSIQGGTLHE
jgi:DNA-binding PadR family transcriptional regulator